MAVRPLFTGERGCQGFSLSDCCHSVLYLCAGEEPGHTDWVGWDDRGTWSSCADAAETCLQQGGCWWPLCLPIYTWISVMPCQQTKHCHAPRNGGFQGRGSWVLLLLVDYFCEMLEKANPVPVQLGGESACSCLPPALPWLS